VRLLSASVIAYWLYWVFAVQAEEESSQSPYGQERQGSKTSVFSLLKGEIVFNNPTYTQLLLFSFFKLSMKLKKHVCCNLMTQFTPPCTFIGLISI